MSELNFRPLIPMGAVPMKEGIEEYASDPDYIAEVKYDGYRMVSWFEKDQVRFTTRSVAIETARAGDPWPTERTDNLPHLRDMVQFLEGTIIDGEIYKPGCTSHDMTSMVGGLPENSIANQEREGYVQYVMYDILQYKGEDTTDWPFWKRRTLLEEIHDDLLTLNENLHFHSPSSLGESDHSLINNYIRLSEQVPHEEKDKRYDELLSTGGEGMILKHKDSRYFIGKIHKGKGVPSKVKASPRKGIPHTPWVKWKKKDTFDCVVMGFKPASRIYKGSEPLETWRYWEGDTPVTKRHFFGWPGSIIFGQYKDGELIEVGYTSGIDEEWLHKFRLEPEKYIGKVIVVEAMERIKKTNALREPRFLYFRPEWDKAPEECTIE